MEAEITGWLKAMRDSGSELRKRLDAHNEQHPAPEQAEHIRVTLYGGQNGIVEGQDEG